MACAVLASGLAAHAALADDPAPASQVPAPQMIVVFGDSQAQGLAGAMQRAVRHGTAFKIQNRTKPGTAISQSAAYDWPAAIAAYMPDANVKTAVLMFGGNDRLPMRPEAGAQIPFRSTAWHDAYRARVASMLKSLTDRHLRVIWVSDPVCREPRYSADMAYLNAIYQDVIAGTGVTYLNIWSAIAAADGSFAAYGTGPGGATERLRLDDGIHFTPSGYDILAAKVLAVVAAPAAPAASTPAAPAASTPAAPAASAPGPAH
jgi:hypothetical protein